MQNGTCVTKGDLEQLLRIDSSEYKVCHKLTNRHLEVTGAERTNVSNHFKKCVKALSKYFPLKSKQADFFRFANDGFDIFNSRIKDDPNQLKFSFGIHLPFNFNDNQFP